MRENGRTDGRIYRRGSRWYVDVWIAGSRVRRSAGTRRADAERLRTALTADAEAARRDPPLALHDALRAYIAGLRSRGKASSVRQAEVHAEILCRHMGARTAAGEIGVDHVDRFVAARVREGLSRASINGSLRYLRASLRRAVDVGRLERVPRIRLLRETRRAPRILTERDVNRLIGAAAPPVDLALIIAAKAGLRHQEILHLQWRDLDLGAGVVTVSAKPPGPGLPMGWTPKAHMERAVPMTPKLRERIEREARGGAAVPESNAWVFPGLEGAPRTSLARPVREVFERVGLYDPLAKPGLHQLRRTWASMVARSGDLPALMQLGGWADLATAQRYLGTTDERMREALAGIS